MSKATDLTASCDETLFEQIKQDDVHAFTRIFDKYREPLLQFVSGYTGDVYHSEEIVQEFFLQLWLKRRVINIRRSLSGYFFRSVRNRTYNYFRDHRGYYQPLPELADLWPDEDIYQSIDRSDRQRRINHLVSTMPAKYGEVYNLRIRHALSTSMTARVLERSVHTVDKQVRKIASRIIGL